MTLFRSIVASSLRQIRRRVVCSILRAGPAVVLLLASFRASAQTETASPRVIVVVGAPGESEYAEIFSEAANHWITAAQSGGVPITAIGLGPSNATSDRDLFIKALADEPKDDRAELWLVLLGHGTFDGEDARFNLRGPDFTASELVQWLKPFKRPLAFVDTSSASAPFLPALSGTNRVIVTATRSGSEENYTRFTRYISEAIADPAADLDKDGQTSLLEAFIFASRRVAEFYASQGRLATEHPLIDDNGDGLGTPADWFRGVHAVKRARNNASTDGVRAQQFCLVRSHEEREMPAAIRQQRDDLELKIAQLRDKKSKMPEDDYYRELEPLLVEMSRLSAGASQSPASK